MPTWSPNLSLVAWARRRSTHTWPLLACALAVAALAGCGEENTNLVRDGAPDAQDATTVDVVREDIAPGDAPPDGPRCSTDDDCRGSSGGPFCDPTSGLCHACLSSPNTCPAGQYCNAMFECAPGCGSDVDCNAGGGEDGGAADAGAARRCDPATHACVACLGDLDCPDPLICSAHECTMGCSESRPCGAGQTCCGARCANLLDDPNNCGACGNACAPGSACCSGVCYNLDADPRNCGGCGTRCTVTNGVAGCAAGRCTVDRCYPGYGDCDRDPTNGCELPVNTDVMNCGACGNVCPRGPHATPICTSGICTSTCEPGFLHCSSNPADGCEVDPATDPNNCGTCGRRCTSANATGGCSGGLCFIASCNPGFGDCNGNAADGCEASTQRDPLNCGACFRACPAGPYSTATCTSGVCGVTCQAGRGDCNRMAGDGCEAAFATDPNNCGACGTVCPPVANATPTCSAARCGYLCRAGFRDCNGSAADGCEIDLRTDANNCGTCGNRCAAPNASTACNAGSCVISACNPGFANCNGNPADGCETNTATDGSNCGACGNVCTGGQICVSGACTLVNPFPSTGADGAFSPTSNTTLRAGVHNFTTINIPAGVTVTVDGEGVLDLRATGDVTVAGTIDLTGGAGGPGDRMAGGGGGGRTGSRSTSAAGTPSGGAGAGGRMPAGSPGIGCGANGAGGAFGGGAGGVSDTTVGGGGGGGPGGGGGGLVGSRGCSGGAGGGAPQGAGGQAGGLPYDGQPGQSGNDVCGGLVAGGGGGSIGASAASDLAVSSTFYPGSGGGGGSGAYGSGLTGASGGGGGGGGALRIASPTRITITGTVRANGGPGGAGAPGNTTCFGSEAGGAGGGGAGGTIYLAAPALGVSGTVTATGGVGGARGANTTGGDGGAGGLGRIRISVSSSACTLSGTFNPPLLTGCTVANRAGYTYIGTYPR